jgi:DNA processing protein
VGVASETVDLVALLRSDQRWATRVLDEARVAGGVGALVESHFGLLAGEARQRAAHQIEGWLSRGIQVATPFDVGYPTCLRWTATPPPLLFHSGELTDGDDRGVAVIGARQATSRGIRAARVIVWRLLEDGFTVISGLAAGIDTAAHEAALDAGGRTVAVVGCGLDHNYPAENGALQRRIGAEGIVISPFWPEVPPSRRTFPMRNGVMAGLSRATVIIEASATSGTRIQARVALAEGRPVLLLPAVLEQDWGAELASRPGAHAVHTTAEVSAALARCRPPPVAA